MTVMPRPSRTKSDPNRQLTQAELEAYAVSYLARFDCTEVRMRQVLARKLGQGRGGGGRGDTSDGSGSPSVSPMVEAVIRRFVEVGYLDDARFARGLATSLLSRGTAPRRMIERLKQRGVDSELATRIIAEQGGTAETELLAASRLVRRKKLGWCRPEPARKERAQKDLAVLARAGFSFDVARRALTTPLDDEPAGW